MMQLPLGGDRVSPATPEAGFEEYLRTKEALLETDVLNRPRIFLETRCWSLFRDTCHLRDTPSISDE
jgi:hypothetical protein